LQHHIFRLTLDDRLCLCPKNDGAKRVLDLGTGTGIWCIEYGEGPASEPFIRADEVDQNSKPMTIQMQRLVAPNDSYRSITNTLFRSSGWT
jgi:ubiquinone/menaquinone biosynthesis C-methylase UbiE